MMILAADVGATKTLIALADAEGARVAVRFERRYADDDYAAFADLVADFLEAARGVAPPGAIGAACFGVAGPVAGGRVALTNRAWTLDAGELRRRFGLAHVDIVNDFAAAASGLEALDEGGLVTLQGGEAAADGNRVVLGAGTGLGVAYAIRDGARWRVVAGEGGHRGFAPENARQARLAEHWRAVLGRVSDESFLSGTGLVRLHAFVRAERGGPPGDLDAALAAGAGAEAITRFADERGDADALAAIDLFVECYGQVAGDHALAVAAQGGVYVAGGIAPKLLAHLRAGPFMRGFLAKGPQSGWMRSVPVHAVTDESLGLRGAAVIAARAAGPRG